MKKIKIEKDETFLSKLGRKISDFFYNLTQPLGAKIQKKFGGVKSKSQIRRSELIFYFSLMAFPIIHFIIFYVIVNGNSFLMAFQRYNPTTGKYFWVGLENIKAILNEIGNKGALYTAIGNSIKVYLLSVLMIPLRVLFPYYIHKKLPLGGFFKVMLFLPHILSTAVLCILYHWFINFVIPAVGENFGVEIPLLMQGDSVFMMAWLYSALFGFGNVLMYLGTMSGISQSVEEYARIDGCSLWQEFCYITLPIILPTIIVYIVNGVAGIFENQLNLHVFLGNNISNTSANTVGFMIFIKSTQGSGKAAYPEPAAIGLLATCVITPLMILLRRWSKRVEKY